MFSLYNVATKCPKLWFTFSEKLSFVFWVTSDINLVRFFFLMLFDK